MPFENTTKRLLDMIAKRAPSTPFGMRKALDFAGVISPCLEDGACAPAVFERGGLTAWNMAIKRAGNQLVWVGSDVGIKSKFYHGMNKADPPPDGAPVESQAKPDEPAGKVTLGPTPGALMDFEAIITTSAQDREKDILRTTGAELDQMAPLLLQHLPTLNIGRHIKETFRDDNRLQSHLAIADTQLGNDAAVLVEFKALRISHGFVPEEVEEIGNPNGGDPSFDIIRFKILEVSLVSIPANSEAIVLAFSRNKLTHPIVKSWAAQLRKSLPAVVIGGFTSPEAAASERVTQPVGFRTKQAPAASTCGCQKDKSIVIDGLIEDIKGISSVPREMPFKTRELPPAFDSVGKNGQRYATHTKTVQSKERWNRSLSKAFDVAAANLEPSSLTYDWVSRYLGCPVKRVYQVSTTVASPRMGSWLTGLKNLLGPDYKLDDVRNISWDKECPPHYEVIQLNSRMSESFLVQGHAFYTGLKGKTNLVLQFSPGWWGLDVTAFTVKDCSEDANKLLNDTWTWATEHNFLKGEAFALSGEFLPKGNEKWEDLFLDPANEKSVKKLVKRLNDKGKEFKNYGAIWSGPPGTGKTLSGRIMRNEIQAASFIWVSARDFYHAGAFGGLSMAYGLAKELSPAVVFIEDVDNWLDKYNVDYLKTELDGIGRSSGILTVLTTNFPEMMPEALIDRPGRFSDVLHFGLPGEAQRQAMLEKWLPGTDARIIAAAVKDTDGMSGAHIYHLADYAKALEEDDGIERASSIVAALKKVAEQRELIDGIQLQGSHYRPTKEATFMVKTALPVLTRQMQRFVKDTMSPCPMTGGDTGAPEMMIADCPNAKESMDAGESTCRKCNATLGPTEPVVDGTMSEKPQVKQEVACPVNDAMIMRDCPDAQASIKEGRADCKTCGMTLPESSAEPAPVTEEGKLYRFDGKKYVAVKALSKKRKNLLDAAAKHIIAALAHDELKSASVSRTLLEKAAVNVKEAMGDGTDGEENPEAGPEANPGIPDSDKVERSAFALLVKLTQGKRPKWDTLHALREAINDAIQIEDQAAAEALVN